MKQATKTPFKSLVIEDVYIQFDDFYDENKIQIYEAIIGIFKSFLTSKKQTLTLRISANINGIPWETDFHFNVQSDLIVLSRDILPFFIEREMYEVCAEIKHIFDKLIKRNNKKLKNEKSK